MKLKHAYRWAPCPAYDIEGTESWLESLASEGLMLTEDGFYLGIGVFDRIEPKKIRYRLDATADGRGFWSSGNGVPDEEARELNAQYGWKYITTRGAFHIYAAEDEDAVELNTDPQVQAIAVDMIRKNSQSTLVSLFMWCIIYPLVMSAVTPLIAAIYMGTWFYLFTDALILWRVICAVVKVVHLKRLKKKMSEGFSLDHDKNWRKKAMMHRIQPIVYTVLVIVWFFTFMNMWSAELMGDDKMKLEDYDGELPFATMEDFAEGKFEYSNYGFSNTIKIKSDLLAPQVIYFDQNGKVTTEDGKKIEGGLSVTYYKTIAPALAMELAREHQRDDMHDHKKRFKFLDKPDIDADYVSAYMALFPVCIIVKDDVMMYVQFYQTGESDMTMQEWAEIMAESITSP